MRRKPSRELTPAVPGTWLRLIVSRRPGLRIPLACLRSGCRQREHGRLGEVSGRRVRQEVSRQRGLLLHFDFHSLSWYCRRAVQRVQCHAHVARTIELRSAPSHGCCHVAFHAARSCTACAACQAIRSRRRRPVGPSAGRNTAGCLCRQPKNPRFGRRFQPGGGLGFEAKQVLQLAQRSCVPCHGRRRPAIHDFRAAAAKTWMVRLRAP
jgi:hypothetical protein